MTGIALVEILELEMTAVKDILKALHVNGKVEIHSEDLEYMEYIITEYTNNELPLKVVCIGNCLVSVTI